MKCIISKHKNGHKGTWRSPDGRTVNQIDNILTDQQHPTNQLNAQSFRRKNADTDHYLLKAELRSCIARINNKRTIRMDNKYDTDRLNRYEV